MTKSYLTRTNGDKALLAVQVIELLNDAFELDKTAINKLMETRVECNKALAWHPTIQSVPEQVSNTSGAAILTTVYKVSILGLLNGIIGVDTTNRGVLEAVYSDSDPSKLLGFQLGPTGRKWLAEARAPQV